MLTSHGPRGSSDSITASHLTPGWLVAGVLSVLGAFTLGLTIGPIGLNPFDVLQELLNEIPGVSIDSGLSPARSAIVTEIRFPRVVLAGLVGGLLAITGGAYQGAFRNPLADPFLLGVAAGAGLGATLAIAGSLGDGSGYFDPVPIAAFVGALLAVVMAWTAGHLGGRSTVSLVLSGVAVASFLTACQTYVLQRNSDVIREVYSWILGRLATSGWSEVGLLAPYFVVTVFVVLRYRRALDVLAVGDEEAASLGISPNRVRAIVVLAASLGAAAAVSVAGLIGFVGIIVPHAVRLVVGVSNRIVLPLSVLFGAAFVVLADLAARTLITPSELPIGVVTAFFGAPFFVLVLRSSRREIW